MNEPVEDLFPLYALGALTDEERAQVDAYLEANPAARARLDELIQVAGALAYSVSPVESPAHVKTALMNRVRADARARSTPAPRRSPLGLLGWLDALRQGMRPAMPVVAGLSLVVAVLAGVWALSLNGEVARLREETAGLRRALLAQREALAQLSATNVQAMAIAGTTQPGAQGQLFADPAARSAVLIVSGLTQLEPGQVYQFWLIRGDTPVSAGVFQTDEQGRAILPVTSDAAVESFDAMGVSIEPTGGSLQPTGDIVMLSELF